MNKYNKGDIVRDTEILDVDDNKVKIKCPDCEEQIWRNYVWLQRARTVSCGCKRKPFRLKNLVGQFIDGCEILSRQKFQSDPNKKRTGHDYSKFICKCRCGSIFEANSFSLKRIHRVSCKNCKNLYVNGVPMNYFNILCKRKDNWEFNITIEYIGDLFKSQNGICKLSGRKIIMSHKKGQQTASLDRINSSLGYIIGNVQWVHKDMNTMKSDWSDEEFVSMCSEIAAFHKPKNEIYSLMN